MNSTLKSFAQVMFQNSQISGLFFFIAIFINSINLAFGMLLGVVASNYFAKILVSNKNDIEDGLYGFNGALVGIALLLFFKHTIWLYIVLIFASFFATYVFYYLKNSLINFQAFTFPFILTVWIVLYFSNTFLLDLQILNKNITSYNIFETIFLNISQVFFQDYYLSGILIAIGVFLNSKRDFFYIIYASFIALIFANLFSFATNDIEVGLYGYNAVLIALSLVYAGKNLFTITLAIILSIFVVKIFFALNLVALTFPFVLVSWIFLYKKTSEV
ncbi:urea transporter [Arcobacter vandammei]|uniref:urea transporter n=1 Tax=Arcobacter vandammei TaxID=2782243 RepID=UPI0018DFDA01|nr:urea transporter [Arcobacter vandammei]